MSRQGDDVHRENGDTSYSGADSISASSSSKGVYVDSSVLSTNAEDNEEGALHITAGQSSSAPVDVKKSSTSHVENDGNNIQQPGNNSEGLPNSSKTIDTSSSRATASSASSCSGSSSGSSFECHICLDEAVEPVVTRCGHLVRSTCS
jgi:hypothetical protein